MQSRVALEIEDGANKNTDALSISTFQNVPDLTVGIRYPSAIAEEISAPMLDSDSGCRQKPWMPPLLFMKRAKHV
jgi:hypothetical protein